MRVTGVVKFFDETRGYGFIRPEDNSQEVFVHRTDLVAPLNELKKDQRVSYELADSNKGTGKKAVAVRLADGMGTV